MAALLEEVVKTGESSMAECIFNAEFDFAEEPKQLKSQNQEEAKEFYEVHGTSAIWKSQKVVMLTLKNISHRKISD